MVILAEATQLYQPAQSEEELETRARQNPQARGSGHKRSSSRDRVNTKIERLKNKVSDAVSTHVAESQTYTDDLLSKLSQGNLNARELLGSQEHELLQQTALKRSGQVMTVGVVKTANLAAQGLDIATFGGFSYLMNRLEQGIEGAATRVRRTARDTFGIPQSVAQHLGDAVYVAATVLPLGNAAKVQKVKNISKAEKATRVSKKASTATATSESSDLMTFLKEVNKKTPAQTVPSINGGGSISPVGNKTGVSQATTVVTKQEMVASKKLKPLDIPGKVHNLDPKNVAAHESYKQKARELMGAPYVEDIRVRDMLEKFYRKEATIGSGSTAAAIRKEIAKGTRVKGHLHIIKGEEAINSLSKWLKANPTARPSEHAAVENVLKDFQEALNTQRVQSGIQKWKNWLQDNPQATKYRKETISQIIHDLEKIAKNQ